jgi:hypothetical protein
LLYFFHQLSSSITECKETLTERRGQLSSAKEEKLFVLGEFSELVPIGHEHYVQLKRIFKQKVSADDDEYDCSDSDDSDSEEDSDEEDAEDYMFDEAVDDFCPEGFDEASYTTILQLRGRYSLLDRKIAFYQRRVKFLNKDLVRYQTRHKQVTKEIQAATQQHKAFQLETQRALHKRHVYRVIETTNVYSWQTNADNHCPDDTKKIMEMASKPGYTVLMKRSDVQALYQRITNVKKDNHRHREGSKDKQKDISSLQHSGRQKKKSIENLKQKGIELQMLKFGQEVNLEELDNLSTVNKETERQNIQSEDVALKNKDEVKKMQSENEVVLEKIHNATSENTRLLGAVGSLKEQENLRQQHQIKEDQQPANAASTAEGENMAHLDRLDEVDELQSLYEERVQKLQAIEDDCNALKQKGSKSC